MKQKKQKKQGKLRISLTVDRDLYKMVQKYAIKHNSNVSQMVNNFFDETLKEYFKDADTFLREKTIKTTTNNTNTSTTNKNKEKTNEFLNN